jgi:MFS family permease
MNETTPEPRRGRRLEGGKQLLDSAYLRADGLLDRGQHHVFRLFWVFLPEASIARRPRFQAIMASRFLSDAGQQSLAYGALIAVVRGGGSVFDAALVGVAALLPPALLGLYGGAVADALPKRVALAAIYNLQAALCFILPFVIGTDLIAILFLVFAVNVLGQVSGPTESSVIPLVASQAELASAASLVSLSSNLGTAFGTALLAPILVRAFSTRVVFYVAGILLVLAATRVFDLSTATDPEGRPNWRRPNLGLRSMFEWLARERAVATMILVGVLAGTANIVLLTLAPRYVSGELHVDPADAVYVFAPSAVGLALALAATPPLIRRRGERTVALAGFFIVAASLCTLGFVGRVAEHVDAVNVVRVVGLVGIELSPQLRTAGFLALFIGFGLALTTTSVQTYINRRVPVSYQGRAFALQSTLKNAAAIGPLLGLGAAASVVGVQNVLIFSPLVLLTLALALVQLSAAFGGASAGPRLDVLASFWEESDDAVSLPDDPIVKPSIPPRATGAALDP